MREMRKGFTLIELLVFIAIFILIIGSFIAILVSTINIQAQQVAIGQNEQQGQFITQQLEYYIKGSRLIDLPLDTATTTLVLREGTSSLDPTTITVSSGTMYVRQGISGTLQPLTSAKVIVSNVSFTRHYNYSSSSAFGIDSISYSFMVTAGNGTTRASQTFQSSIAVLAPVPKIARIQQVKAEANSTGLTSITAGYPSNNEAGDLLIAAVANSDGGTSSISDTLGNTWSLLGSTTYFTRVIAIYAALNAKAGANTTTVTFGPSESYGSVYLYEYRGASTASSFDTWGAQSLATSTPSSGLVYPTSTSELLIGFNYNISTNEVPSAGTGYVLETSSTVNNTTQVFMEDKNQFISGPVSAGWKYTGTPSSTSLIATFK